MLKLEQAVKECTDKGLTLMDRGIVHWGKDTLEVRFYTNPHILKIRAIIYTSTNRESDGSSILAWVAPATKAVAA